MSDKTADLGRDKLIYLLNKLGEELAEQGTMGEIVVYGGSALMLMYDFRASTHDVDFTALDSLNNGQYRVLKAATKISAQEGINSAWMNDAIEVFVSDTPDMLLFGEFPKDKPGLRVFTATPEYIFTMKMLAMRPSTSSSDMEDIWNLIDICHINSVSEAKERLEDFYPNKILPKKNELLLMDIYNAKEQGGVFEKAIGW